jgi:hypothetical protein
MSVVGDNQDGQFRKCRDCGEIKPLTDFHASPRRAGGRGSYCKPCFNIRSQASYAKRVAERHGRQVAQKRQVPEGFRYCPDCEAIKPLEEFPRNRNDTGGHGRYCKPCHNARGRESKQRLFGGSREYHLRRRYGIGQADFDRIMAQQGGVCPICGRENPEHVDHDHVTGELRGILCFNCNQGLGNFRDSPQAMARAIEYLSRFTPPWNEIGPQVSLVLLPRQRSDEPVGSRS